MEVFGEAALDCVLWRTGVLLWRGGLVVAARLLLTTDLSREEDYH